MFNIRPGQLVDAVVTIIKNNGTHSMRRITEARFRSDGTLQLIFAPNFTGGTLVAERLSATLFPNRWLMTHYHHIYSFSRADGHALKPHRTHTIAYVISPRP